MVRKVKKVGFSEKKIRVISFLHVLIQVALKHAKARLVASKVETSVGIVMQISRFRLYQNSYKIVSSDDV